MDMALLLPLLVLVVLVAPMVFLLRRSARARRASGQHKNRSAGIWSAEAAAPDVGSSGSHGHHGHHGHSGCGGAGGCGGGGGGCGGGGGF